MHERRRPLGVTETVLHGAQQSLLDARLRLEDMLPIAGTLDRVGFWALETAGGAVFDAAINHLGEDPWARIRALRDAIPNTPQQMLLHGQCLLGYRPCADDVVDAFIARARANGIDVFRVCDALNDPRNLERALRAVVAQGGHAQGAMVYTLSPKHDLEGWVALARRLEAMGVHSVAIRDVAGLLTPATAHELMMRLKRSLSVPLHLECHITGLSAAALVKAVEAGVDNVDTAISALADGHSPTEALVASLRGTECDSGLGLAPLEDVAAYFRQVRRKYAAFEGSLKGSDSRLRRAQVPGGLLAGLERQLEAQGAAGRLDEVLSEIPRIRKDLGFIPLDTPTAQIVIAQALVNVLTGERYRVLSNEIRRLLAGEYGTAPAPFDEALRRRALGHGEPATCRPAERLAPQMPRLRDELRARARAEGFRLEEGERETDDVLTYALFPQSGLGFLKQRDACGVSEQTS